MTSRERIFAAVSGQKSDVLPVAPYAGNFCAVKAGIDLDRYYCNPEIMAQAQLTVWRETEADVIVPQSDNYYIAEGFGCRVDYPENRLPVMLAPALGDLEEVDELIVPDPDEDGRMPVFIEAVSLIYEELGHDVAIRSGGTGPFSLAGHLLGTENFMVAIAMAEADEDKIRQQMIFRLLEKTSDALIAFQKAILEAGGSFAVCGDSSASPDLVSPLFYEKYIFPFEKKVFDAINPVCRKHDAVSLLHICGDTTSILPLMKKTGADILELDHKVDLAHARSIVGGSQCLMGNIDPTAVLLQGTPNDVRYSAVECFKRAGQDGSFILGSGCEVPPETPMENFLMMIEAARDIRY